MNTIVMVRLGDVVIRPEINTRRLDAGVVTSYREDMKEMTEEHVAHRWKQALGITEENILWRGFHTAAALLAEFGPDLQFPAEVSGETERDAHFLACGTNTTHGYRATNVEKEVAVRRYLEDEEMCQWTDRYIADKCGVSQPFVSKIRSLITVISQPTLRKFINNDGEVEWIETAKIGNAPKLDRKAIYDAMTAERDKAYAQWHSYCERHEMEFEWREFCVFAEKYQGSYSMLYPDHEDIKEIEALSERWKELTSAIARGASWIAIYRQEHTAPLEREPLPPDHKGLRKNLEAMKGVPKMKPIPATLSKLYHVPEAEVEALIEEIFGNIEKNQKELEADEDDLPFKSPLPVDPLNIPQPTPTTDPSPPPSQRLAPKPLDKAEPSKPFESTNTGIVFKAHNEARNSYYEMMGCQWQTAPAGDDTKYPAMRYWDDFCEVAKTHAPRGKGMPRGKHKHEQKGDGSQERYTLPEAERVVEAWGWIQSQCEVPRPQWVKDWIYQTCCKMSEFSIVLHGHNFEGELGRFKFSMKKPIDAEDLERITDAIRDVVETEITMTEEQQEIFNEEILENLKAERSQTDERAAD